ncbi:MAG: hypothetical protein KBC26_01955 [Candidatus Pacebacteria bacterium]|nr:hypothetical protein [Candidatus Paceibacterota bacterium]
MKWLGYKKNIGIITAIIVVLIVAPLSAHASALIGAIPALPIINTILLTINSIAGALVKFGAMLINVGVQFNQLLAEDITRKESFIYIGWTVFRDIANLGFVLAIIAMAIGTILRYKEYVWNKMLFGLIVSALLVNFSLVIAGTIIRVSDVFSNFLIEQIGGKGTEQFYELGNSLMGEVGNYKNLIVSDDKSIFQKITDFVSIQLQDTISLFVSVVVGLVIFLVFLGLGASLFVRYFYLAMLLIISPMVWLLRVIPFGKAYWGKWWGVFNKWVFYVPIVLLFMWLVISFSSMSQDVFTSRLSNIGSSSNPSAQTEDVGANLGNARFRDIMLPIIVLAMMIFGMKFALSFAGGGAQMALGLANKATQKTTAWSKTKLRRAGGRMGRATLESKPGKWGRKKVIAAGSNRFGRMFGLGVAARKIEEKELEAEKVSSEYSREFEKELDTMKPEQVMKLISTMTGERRAATIAWLTKKKKVKEVVALTSLSDRIAAIETMRKVGRAQDAADMEKKFGMTYDMMRALQAPTGEIEVEETVKDPETGLPKRDPVTHEEIKEIKRKKYQDLAGAFYGKFSPSDWSQMAETVGSAAFSSDPQIEGLGGEDQATTFRQAYASAIVSSRGRAVHSTAPRLEGKNLDIFYTQTIAEGIRGLRKRISDVDTAIAQKREEGGKEKEVAILEERKKKLKELADKIGSVDPKKILDPAEIQKKLEIMQQGVTRSKKGKEGKKKAVTSSEQVIDQELSELGQKLASSRASIMGGYTSGATPQQETTSTPQTPPSGGEKGK